MIAELATVIPTTITTDDSIGIIYTTVIQFDYLREIYEWYYAYSVMIEKDLTITLKQSVSTNEHQYYNSNVCIKC